MKKGASGNRDGRYPCSAFRRTHPPSIICSCMSGIATYTNAVAKLLAGTKTTLLDTRKTTPCMRVFEKYAVTVGGGSNHRYNLSDGVMLKDNHIGAAGGVKEAIAAAKAYAPFVRKIEVETETLDMVREAVEAGADIIMLDNMSPRKWRRPSCIIDGRSRNRMLRQYDNRKYQNHHSAWGRLCIQRCADPFRTYSGYQPEKSPCGGISRSD